LEDSRYGTAEKRAAAKFELYPVLDEAFRKKTRADWEKIFRENGFRCDGCLDYTEFVSHPQFEANDMVVEVDHHRDGKIKMLGFPVKFKGSEKAVDLKPPPVLGEHTEEILGELEYSQEVVDKLKDEGIVGTPTPDMFVPVKRSILRSTQVSRRYDRKKAELKKQKK
jgi:crotonobetainyl-CoA:carnitine CoA-transferase CaiB-like acyl-CoA transferase